MSSYPSDAFDQACELVYSSTLDAGKALPPGQITLTLFNECIEGDGVCLLAKAGSRVAGCVVLLDRLRERVPHYEVWSLYVCPKYRGAGVANQLIDSVVSYLECPDAAVLITTTGPARPFYKSLGFEEECRINTSSVSKIKEALKGV